VDGSEVSSGFLACNVVKKDYTIDSATGEVVLDDSGVGAGVVIIIVIIELGCCCLVFMFLRRSEEEPGILEVKLSPDAHVGPDDDAINGGLRVALKDFGEIDTIELHNKGDDIKAPFAMVSLQRAIPDDHACQQLLRDGSVDVMGARCVLKLPGDKDEKAEGAAAPDDIEVKLEEP
jgi:hypothetical protein